jgi:hypothetical protein
MHQAWSIGTTHSLLANQGLTEIKEIGCIKIKTERKNVEGECL